MPTQKIPTIPIQRRASTQESRITMNPFSTCCRRRRASLADEPGSKADSSRSVFEVPTHPPKLKGCQYRLEPHSSCAATTTDEDEEPYGHEDQVIPPIQAILSPTAAAKRSLTAAALAAAAAARRATSVAMAARLRMSTVLREQTDNNDLFLFREEAEYSDYMDALMTGIHTEMDSVVYYELNVHLSQTQWTVLRRFSEFRLLRKRLLKHFSNRVHFQSRGTKCPICASIQQTIEQLPFPSRTATRKYWPFYTNSFDTQLIDRKHKLQDFILTCLFTIRGLRQHSRLMYDSSACEVSIALRMIEEFMGLSFTRYMRFLNERGIVNENHHKEKNIKKEHSLSLANEVRILDMKPERPLHHHMIQSLPHINKRRATVIVA